MGNTLQLWSASITTGRGVVVLERGGGLKVWKCVRNYDVEHSTPQLSSAATTLALHDNPCIIIKISIIIKPLAKDLFIFWRNLLTANYVFIFVVNRRRCTRLPSKIAITVHDELHLTLLS